MPDAVLEAALRRDRHVVATALILLVLLSWAYLLRLVAEMDMTDMAMGSADMAAMMMPRAWSMGDFWYVLVMWVVMMLGMMTPSAAPVILLYARVGRQAADHGQPFAATGWFAAGYLFSWAGFSLAATFAQWALDRLNLLSPMMETTSNVFGGILLIAAGAYQWTPLKYACLSQCQAPLAFVQRHGGFRPEASRSVRLGAFHGAYCVACCWALMTLLFVGGVMNVFWIAGIAILVLLEKAMPAGRLISRLAGVVFIVAGMWFLTNGLITPQASHPA